MRALWHQLFDPCPLLLQRVDDGVNAVFDAFLDWANDACHPMDWTLHLTLLRWLEEKRDIALEHQECRELMAAAAMRWTRHPAPKERSLAIWHEATAPWLIVARKALSLSGPPRIFAAKAEMVSAPAARLAYTTGTQYAPQSAPLWASVEV
jgi:hypothetical protein